MNPKEEFESKPLSFILFSDELCAVLAEIEVYTVGDLMYNIRPVVEHMKRQTDRELINHFVIETKRMVAILESNFNMFN